MSVQEAAGGWTGPSPARVRAVRDRLRLVYGRPLRPPHGRPVDGLVLTVLSQSTNDRNRDVAFLALRERLPSWEQVRDAPTSEVEEAIRPGGISQVKSVRLGAMLHAIGSPLELDWLAGVGVAEGRSYLCSLPGVGRKTGACVLLFSFGHHDVPVDTHVGRVAVRLGLLRPGASSSEHHDAMLALTPRGQALELHLNLLRHGRRTCVAQRPRCARCALQRMCPTGRMQSAGARERARRVRPPSEA